MWVPPETKAPVVYHHPTLNSVGYFAAVRLRDGLFLFRRQTGRFNGESFWEFLKVFKEASAVGGRRVLAISDNAQYHRSKLHLNWRLEQTPGFGLDFLPPYSPELNPIERVWKLTRRLLHNRYLPSSIVWSMPSKAGETIPFPGRPRRRARLRPTNDLWSATNVVAPRLIQLHSAVRLVLG